MTRYFVVPLAFVVSLVFSCATSQGPSPEKNTDFYREAGALRFARIECDRRL
ncbi:MAG: hypothetical protein JXA30_23165 [Deltaproteobacteria bacterium]|nr:hypothetical protein [Deltaproteobacteria bacterium]